MQTEIDRLLEGILKTQRTLGEEHFLLSPKVLSDFLKNEHAVLEEDIDKASLANPMGGATVHVASVFSSKSSRRLQKKSMPVRFSNSSMLIYSMVMLLATFV